MFIDGISQAVNTFSGTFTGTFANVHIGQNTLAGNFFHGKIAQLGLFNRVLTDSEIGKIYVANREPLDLLGVSGLVAYYKLDEGSGTIALDELRQANGSLFNNAIYSTEVPFKAG